MPLMNLSLRMLSILSDEDKDVKTEEYVLITTILSCLISGFTILGHLFYYNE